MEWKENLSFLFSIFLNEGRIEKMEIPSDEKFSTFLKRRVSQDWGNR
jgi:hypothetical protein